MATLNNLDGGGSLQNLNGIHKVPLNGSLNSKGNFLGSKNGLHASRTFQLSSQQNLLKKKQIEKENAAVYKLKRQLEGEETDRAIESSGCVEWSWSKRQDSEIHTLKFTPDNNYIAVGCGDGQISIYHLPTQNRLFALNPDMKMNSPCTSICFRPENEDLDHINKNIFAASYADGTIRHWHLTTGKQISKIDEGDIQSLFITYSKNGSEFVTCGSDNNIRIYDSKTHQLKFNGKDVEENGNIGHSNRIFCAKFHPNEPNMVVSGGWDDSILIWDSRKRNPAYSIFGPRICGDSIDFNHNGSSILTGSYSREKKLQIWSWQNREIERNVKWSQNSEATSTLLYSAQYSKGATFGHANNFILAGGSGNTNEVKLFTCANGKCAGSISSFNCSVFATAISKNDDLIAVGGGGKMLMLFNVQELDLDNK